jgi:hypothetical protein
MRPQGLFRRLEPLDQPNPLPQFHCLEAAQLGGFGDHLFIIRAIEIDRPIDTVVGPQEVETVMRHRFHPFTRDRIIPDRGARRWERKSPAGAGQVWPRKSGRLG